MPTGRAFFPGLTNNIKTLTMPLIHGIAPGVGSITAVPFAGFANTVGDLVLTYGSTTIRFPDCSIVNPSLRGGANSPRMWSLSVLDRRWKWKFGEVSGRYNSLRPDNMIDDRTEKTPRELATLLLNAMGEENYDISALPDTARPFIDWYYTNPALELQNLCESLGCRVILQLDNRVVLKRVSVGDPLPQTGQEMNLSFGMEGAAVPDKIKLIGGPTLFQSRLVLQAVAQDIDRWSPASGINRFPDYNQWNVGRLGETKRLGLISYAPPTYGFQDPENFSDILPTYVTGGDGIYTRSEVRQIAKSSVYKWYRPIGLARYGQAIDPVQPSLVVQGLGYDYQRSWDDQTTEVMANRWESVGQFHEDFESAVSDASRIRILPTKAETSRGIDDGWAFQPATIRGFVTGDGPAGLSKIYDVQRGSGAQNLDTAFSVDSASNLVKFSQPVYKMNQAPGAFFGNILGASLYLDTSFHVLDDNNNPVAFQRELDLPGVPAAGQNSVQIVFRPEFQNVFIQRWSSEYLQRHSGGLITITEKLQQQADDYLNLLRAQYIPKTSTDVMWAGLVPINLDGITSHVTFSLGDSQPTTTRAGQHTDLRGQISFNERRMVQNVRDLVMGRDRARRDIVRGAEYPPNWA